MQKLYKNGDGLAIIEATLLLPFCMIMVISIFYASIFLCQKANLQAKFAGISEGIHKGGNYMLDFIDGLYIRASLRFKSFLNNLKNDESGVSAFVATILLIVIVVALCVLFWKEIKFWFGIQWAKINTGSERIGK